MLHSISWAHCPAKTVPESGIRHTAKHTARKNTTHQLQYTSASKGPAYTVKPRFTNASDHEQFGLRTNFPNTKRLG
jgi:hypothetical protein